MGHQALEVYTEVKAVTTQLQISSRATCPGTACGVPQICPACEVHRMHPAQRTA
jgi:hypothetical protein